MLCARLTGVLTFVHISAKLLLTLRLGLGFSDPAVSSPLELFAMTGCDFVTAVIPSTELRVRGGVWGGAVLLPAASSELGILAGTSPR